MYESLLVPLDGSGAAQVVLPYVVEIAARLNSEIILVSVAEPKAADFEYLYRSYLEHVAEMLRLDCADAEGQGVRQPFFPTGLQAMKLNSHVMPLFHRTIIRS